MRLIGGAWERTPQALDIGARVRERRRMGAEVDGAGLLAMVVEKDVVGFLAMVVESDSVGCSLMVIEVGRDRCANVAGWMDS